MGEGTDDPCKKRLRRLRAVSLLLENSPRERDLWGQEKMRENEGQSRESRVARM